MDAYVGAQRAGSGRARLSGDGTWCVRLWRQCVLHKTINMSLEICMNVFKMSIFHLKYVQFRTGRKFSQNVNMSFEICVKVLHLIQNFHISFEICTTVVVSCVDPSKILTFHLKYM